MCLAHPKAISLLSKLTQRAIFQLGAISRYSLENDCKIFASTLAQSIPHRKPIFASGAAGRRRGAFHMNLPVCTLIGQWLLCMPCQQITGVWEEEEVIASQNTGAEGCFAAYVWQASKKRRKYTVVCNWPLMADTSSPFLKVLIFYRTILSLWE